MGKHVNKAIENALAAVEIRKARIVALHFALDALRTNKTTEEAFAVVSAALYADLNAAYAHVFMWGTVGNKETRKEAVRIAANSWLKENVSIMDMLSLDLRHPSAYLASTEAEFRAEIDKLLDAQ